MKTIEEVLIKKGKLNPSTKKIYTDNWHRFKRTLEGKTPTVELAELFLSTHNMEKSTYNNYAGAMRHFFRGNNISFGDSFKMFTSKAINNVRSDKYVTFKQVNEIVDVLDNLQEKVMVRLLFHGGMRSGSEFNSLNVGDIDFKEGKLKVKGSKKSKKIRTVNLIEPDYIIPLIKRYLKQRGINPENLSVEDRKQPLIVARGRFKGERLKWGGVRHLCNKIRGIYPELPDLSGHWFRHGHAVWCKIDGMPIDLCAIQLGNTTQVCAEIYRHFSELDVDRYFREREQTKEENEEYVDPLSEVTILRDKINKMEKDFALIQKYLKLEAEEKG